MGKQINEREVVLEILMEITENGAYSHKILGDVLSKYQYLEKRERAFITRVVEGTLEHMIEIDYILNQISKTKVKKMKPVIRNLLRSSVYQLKYMDSVPDHAVCSEAVKLAVRKGFSGLRGYVNGVLRNVVRKMDEIEYPKEDVQRLSVKYSVPEWILSLWKKEYGEEITEKMAADFQKEKPITIRCCMNRVTPEVLKEKLEAEGAKVEAHPYLPYAFYLSDYDYLEGVVDICEKSGVHTKFIPDYSSLIPSRPYTEDLMGLPVINIRYVPLTNTGNMVIKRAMDIVGSIFGIIITSPIMLISAILVKLSSPGPVIFKQERVGLHNKPFYMYKFRSMAMQTAAEEKKGWTVRNDPRVTGIGKVLRRTSIDELPQLFNILKGDMSLVGPRPERPQFVEKFKEEIPRYMVKHQVRPGLTGWAQVNGLRGDSSIKKRIEYDIYYIENWTIGFDIKIILMTFFTGFINKNAY